jgi:competence transcription factor ComK
MSKEILLRISNDKIWVNDEYFLDIKNTDIPCKDLSFNERKPIFWKVEMKSFNRDRGKLNVNILDYKCQYIRGFNKQKPKYEIKYLEFLYTIHFHLRV